MSKITIIYPKGLHRDLGWLKKPFPYALDSVLLFFPEEEYATYKDDCCSLRYYRIAEMTADGTTYWLEDIK